MRQLSRILWLAPFAAHVAYLLATSGAMPEAFGARPWEDDPGIPSRLLVAGWLGAVGLANVALLAVHLRLPRLSDRLLAVPGKERWLAGPKSRAALVEHLRGFLESALVLLNVFFLAVYQGIYQAAVQRPVLTVGFGILVAGFMAAPLALVALAFGKLLIDLRRGATR